MVMVRRTYYYSQEVADALATAVARIHHNSHGRITKHQALDAIITAGVEQVDAVERRLRPG
jgi:archaeosine-15-forming tRNA-guanine transglycosylase